MPYGVSNKVWKRLSGAEKAAIKRSWDASHAPKSKPATPPPPPRGVQVGGGGATVSSPSPPSPLPLPHGVEVGGGGATVTNPPPSRPARPTPSAPAYTPPPIIPPPPPAPLPVRHTGPLHTPGSEQPIPPPPLPVRHTGPEQIPGTQPPQPAPPPTPPRPAPAATPHPVQPTKAPAGASGADVGGLFAGQAERIATAALARPIVTSTIQPQISTPSARGSQDSVLAPAGARTAARPGVTLYALVQPTKAPAGSSGADIGGLPAAQAEWIATVALARPIPTSTIQPQISTPSAMGSQDSVLVPAGVRTAARPGVTLYAVRPASNAAALPSAQQTVGQSPQERHLAGPEPGQHAMSSGYTSSALSPEGRAVFGLPPQNMFGLPPQRERVQIKPGISISHADLQGEIVNHVVPVTAADIRVIAAVPYMFIHNAEYLLHHPSALLDVAVAFYLHRSKEGEAIRRAGETLAAIHTGSVATIRQTLNELSAQYASDMVQEIKDELRNKVLSAGFGDVGGEFAGGLIDAVRVVWTAAAVAVTIKEARTFRDQYRRALNHPAGKNFLLNLQSTVDHKTLSVPGTPVTVSPSVLPAQVGTVVGGRLPDEPRLGGAASRSRGSGSTTVVRTNVGLGAFIYWWAGR